MFIRPMLMIGVFATLLGLAGCANESRRSQASVASTLPSVVADEVAGRWVEPMDLGWRFFRGEAENGQAVDCPDSVWRQVDVPHDWSIEGPFAERNPMTWRGGYLPSGTAWYRRHIKLDPRHVEGERVYIDFDGVMANAEVWVNGSRVPGTRPWGYLGFRCDVTDVARWGGDNVVAVRTDTTAQPASRWYTGSGIYRHVWLVRTGPVHVDHWGVTVTTPSVHHDVAQVKVVTQVRNELVAACAVRVSVQILGPDGKEVGKVTGEEKQVGPGHSDEFSVMQKILAPHLWNPEGPELYQAVIEVKSGSRTVDRFVSRFGVREARFDAETGFWLNGKNIKLKGVCLHHDAGGLGAAVPRSVWRKRLEQLRIYGVNAVRTSHNPVDPEFLELCDELGFLVMDEALDAWRRGKVPHDYGELFDQHYKQDIADMVRRDRNHPSIILYSAGNEIHDVLYDPPLGLEVFRDLREVFHAADPTRPVTVAVNQPEKSKIHESGFADLMDVAGYNYREQYSVDGRKTSPKRKIVGTENSKSARAWQVVRDNPDLAGMFLWTGYDYIGESVRRWPYFTFEFGMFDFSGNPRPVAEQFRAYWTDKPIVSVARLEAVAPLPSGTKLPPERYADWNPPCKPGEIITLEVFSNCKAVELFLNGRSLGTREVPDDASGLKWPTLYEPGEIRAIGKVAERGTVVCETVLRTAGSPARVEVTVDRSILPVDREEVCYVTARLTDRNGITVTSEGAEVHFDVSGPAILLATESGNLQSHELFQAPTRRTFRGRCTAIYRASGPGAISIRAHVGGLEAGSVVIQAVPAARHLQQPDR